MPQLSFATPLGAILIVAEQDALTELHWRATSDNEPTTGLLRQARQQILAYFSGERRAFDLPLAPRGTGFQRRLWQRLGEIGYGQTVSYGEVAHWLDSGPRAVGGACGKNPLPLLIPCHRVLAAGGRLGGYSGGRGLDTKRFLLSLEGAEFAACFT